MTLPPPPPTPIVTTTAGGIILGKRHDVTEWYPRAVDAFYGIPYARVPARFRSAVAIAPGSFSRLDARQAGKGEQPTYMAASASAEKSLTLNVFRPSRPAAESGDGLLPVVVYVHGGGFNFGEPLERDHVSFVSWAGRSNVLVVSVCYRLGVLGFAAGQGKGSERELNLGLKDQRLALGWIRKHIGAFGGNGEDLTFMGVSAGAHSIGHHILDPRESSSSSSSKPLFRKAIMESGSATARSVLSATHPRVQSQLESLESHVPVADKTLETLDVATLLEATVMVWAENAAAVTWPFQPVVEDDGSALTQKEAAAVIPAPPLTLWDEFAQNPRDMAVITGFCSHEGAGFVPGTAATNADFRAFFATLIPSLTAQDLDLLEALYPDPVANPTSPYRNDEAAMRCGKGAQFTRLHEAYAHYAYIGPVLHTAHMLSSMAAQFPPDNRPVVKVYVYEYAARAGPLAAAGHGDQAPIVAHDMVQLHGRPGLSAVADAMHTRWTAFAASPDGTLPDDLWPAFASPFVDGGGDGTMLVFGKGNDEKAPGGKDKGVPVMERTVTEREKRQCAFWWARMGLSQGRGERMVTQR